VQSISQLLQAAQRACKENKFDRSREYCQQILDSNPNHAEAQCLLGTIAFQTGNIQTSLQHFKAAVDNKNDDPKMLFNYASVLLEIGHFSDALKLFSTVCKLQPDNLYAMNKCAVILGNMGNLGQAKELCRLILSKDPSYIDAYINLGNIYKASGLVDNAHSYYKKALALNPGNKLAASNLLLCLNYSNKEPEEIFKEHLDYERRFKHLLKGNEASSYKRDSKKCKINIGYISGDFRIHSVGYFIEPIIENHDTEKFNLFCYSDLASPDETTARIRNNVSTWRSIYNLHDDAVFSMIRKDEIDILVDLAGHSGDNRLTLFLRKPAPVQVTYLGYPNTTGLSTMDYRLTDSRADPEGCDRFYTEKLIRLPDSFLCYRPPDIVPPVQPAPAVKNGSITFGSFNNLSKINDYTIKVWADLLRAVPDSKLFLKTKPFNDRDTRNRYQDLFIQRGIAPDKLLLKGHSYSTEEHLNEYSSVDIALDTFPYNGTTTTFEALLMGVPTITPAGKCHAGRVGVSIITTLDMAEMIAQSDNEYINIAAALAKDISTLSEIRQHLRNKLLHSRLCDGKKFTQNLEKLYFEMTTLRKE